MKGYKMNNNRKSHARKVFECYMDIKNDKSFAKYGKKTREDAWKMYKEEEAKKLGMTLEEFEQWVKEEE